MKRVRLQKTKNLFFLLFAFVTTGMMAQTANGQAGIQQAATEIAGYFDVVGTLIMAIGGIVGLVGGVRCYIAWNSGDQNVNKMLMGWFGSCIFLVVVGVVIQAFFGL